MRNFLIGLSAAAMLAACQTTPVNNFDVAAMDSLLSGAVDSGEIIGVSALVFDEGQVVYENAFGLRDRERGDPVELDTVFRIYSMSKPITSALIMDLVEEGKISLDDPVSKYIPELADMQVAGVDDNGTPKLSAQTSPMTIEDLLLHRAGLGYGIFGPMNPVEELYEKAGLFEQGEDLSAKMQKLSRLPLVAQPGDGWYYSYSIDVLGRVAEVVTDEKFSDLLQDRIFDPLGMKDTGFYVRPDQKPRFASNYALTENGFVLQEDGQTSEFLTKPEFESGGGGLISTLDDYAAFAQMLLQGGSYKGVQILKPETVRLMMSDHMDPDDTFMMSWLGADKNKSFAYGGSIITGDTEDQIAATGEAEGTYSWGGMARTNFHVDPNNNAFAVIMLQYFVQPDPPIHDAFRALVTQEVRDD
ncbi:MAG: beta-lactamase family protein [Hellea sp.]|nr:beta-lactamase family protein [Hellea sp.]